MTTPQDVADRYVALWNETDQSARRKAIEGMWAPDGRHFVRSLEASGHDALQQRITNSYEKNVRDGGNRFRARHDARRLKDMVAFHWEMIPADGGDVLAVGLEVLLLDGEGLIAKDYQFV